jgi:hypothetical protein
LAEGLSEAALRRAVHFPLLQWHQAFGLGHRIRCAGAGTSLGGL